MKKVLIGLISFSLIIGVLVVSTKCNVDKTPIEKTKPVDRIPAVTIEDVLNVISKEELKQHLYWLCSPELEGRMSAKKGNDKARDYLVKYFTDLGYETRTQEFSVQNINNFKEKGTGKTANVIAMLPGNGAFAGETVVIGAHFDHIGYGPSMSRTPNRREIHPGADDNASGTVALMGAAKALIKMKGKNNRRIVFIAFSGEEMGLIGSRHYVNNPVYSNTVFMLNMDMVGRLNNTVDVMGVNSPQVMSVLDKIKGYPFRSNIVNSGGGGGSDHAPFHQKQIPVCFLHTGMHGDYHTPDDVPGKIDFGGLMWVSKYAAHIVWEVAQLPNTPRFQQPTVNFDDDEFDPYFDPDYDPYYDPYYWRR